MPNKWLSSPKKGAKAAASLAIADGDANDKVETEDAKSNQSFTENPDLEAKDAQAAKELLATPSWR